MNKTLDAQIAGWLGERAEEFTKDLLDLIAIPSVKETATPGCPCGRPAADALDHMLSLCAKAGLETANIDGYCGEASCGDGELTAGVLTHLDIVPAGNGWTKNPWGEVADGKIYGRGSTDDKGPAVASLYALRALLAAKAPLKNRVRLIFGCDEETGMEDMRHYLARRKAPDYAFSPDAQFPVIHAEKTIVRGTFHAQIKDATALVSFTGGTRSNIVPDAAQARMTGMRVGLLSAAVEKRANILLTVENDLSIVRSEGIPAHASTPHRGRNAILQLIEYLAEVLPPMDAALPYMRALASLPGAMADGSALSIDCRDEASGPLTFNLGLAELIDNRLTFTYDIRHPVTLDAGSTIERLRESLADIGFSAPPPVTLAGLYVPADHPLVSTLSAVYARTTGRKAKPIAIGGGTYARTLPCAVAFGPVFPGRPETAHMADENMRVDDLLSAARIFAHAIEGLANL